MLRHDSERACGLAVVDGAIAQLVEHLHGMQGVSGSNPLGSISRINQSLTGFLAAFKGRLFNALMAKYHF